MKTFWVLFYVVYVCVISYTSSHVVIQAFQVSSPWLLFVFLAGVLTASSIHAQRSKINVAFIMVHIILEIREHSLHSTLYKGSFIASSSALLHSGMDFTFLWKEVRTHFHKKMVYAHALFVIFGVSALWWYIDTPVNVMSFGMQYNELVPKHIHTSWYSIFTHGGMVACALTHLLESTQKLSQTQKQIPAL